MINIPDNTIVDIKCPHCGKMTGDICNTDEIEFSPDGTGHYYADCYCTSCKGHFRMYYEFKYEITKSWDSGKR